MEQKALSDEMERTLKLLADLQGLRGRLCKRCESELCHHEALLSLSMGFKNAPLCCSCLAAELEREPVQMRDELWSFIVHRPCHRAGWAWANREEGYDPADLPGCLWPSPRKASERPHGTETVEKVGRVMRKRNLGRRRYGVRGSRAGAALALAPDETPPDIADHGDDPGAREDIPAWCRLTGHALLEGGTPSILD